MIKLDLEGEEAKFVIGGISERLSVEDMLESDGICEQVYLAQVYYLKNNDRISNEQKDTFTEMLKSPDVQNKVMACIIIDKFDNNEYNI